MKLSKIILSEILHYDPEYNKEVDNLKDQGGVYIGSGDYGSVYLLDGKAYKVTTDPVELEHAETLEGKKTNNFVHIYNVRKINDKLGVIVMEVLGKLKQDITDEFLDNLEKEAENLGIDPEELDIKEDNFMQDPRSGKIKMVDI